MDEITGNPPMKKARALLQSTFKEITKTPVLYTNLFLCFTLVNLVASVAFWSWLVKQQYDFFISVLIFLIGYNAFGGIGAMILASASRLRLTSCKAVAQRVNEALQMDGQMDHLAVEFHDSELPGYAKMTSPRFQFVLRPPGTALAVMV